MTTFIRHFEGLQDYIPTWRAMQAFTNTRRADIPDEIWLLEHPPIFTQGQNGKREHLLSPGTIPVETCDRGGQITYHGPGQLMVYTLIDLKRQQWTVRDLVNTLESSVIQLLNDYAIIAHTQPKAPGVYVDHKKICSIGLRIRRGSAFHGLALNVDMDLAPFSRIHPCGFPELEMTQMSSFQKNIDIIAIGDTLANNIKMRLIR